MNSVHPCAITILFLTTMLSAQSGLDWRGHDVFPRYNYSGFAQDTRRDKVVRYGGWRGGVLSNETWEWDGRHWRQMHPKHSPPPLSAPILGYDAVTQRVILFGGINQATPRGFILGVSQQTWAWDGKDWVQLSPKNRPSSRFSNSSGMVTDLKRRQLLLYGGSVPGGLFSLPLEDFWAWDGKDWKPIMIKAPPGRMEAYSSGYHAKTGQVLFFGGQPLNASNIFVYSDATWSWNGKAWKNLGSSSSSWIRPSPRICGRLCESPTDGSLLLHGGQSWDSLKSREIHYDDLWSFDGKQWKLLSGSTGLPKNPELRTKDLYRFGKEIQQIFKDRVGYGISDVRRWTGKKWELLERLPEEPLETGVLVLDEIRHQVLLVGGNVYPRSLAKLLLYRLRNGRFEEIPTKVHPPFEGTGAFFDGKNGRLVYMERLSTNYKSLTIWLWNGQSWNKSGTTASIPIGTNGCYYPPLGKIVLPGLKSTWTWDGSKFEKIADHKDPFRVEITYDARRKALVGYGPEARSTSIFYTWEWTGKSWKKVTTKTKPPQLRHAKLEYFPEMGKVILAGGIRIGLAYRSNEETWAFDGKDWQRLSLSPLPVRQGSAKAGMSSMIYDPGQGRLLGLYSNAHVALRELSFHSLSLSAPLIRAGERTSFDIDLPKAAGQFFLLGLSLGRDPGIPLYHEKDIGTRLLPLALDTLLLWSFSGPILTQLDAKGQGSIPFAIPKIPNLPELDIWAAGFTLDPKQSFRIGTTSNRSLLQIVR